MSKLFLPMCVFALLILSNQNRILFELTKRKPYDVTSMVFMICAFIVYIVEIIMIIK